MASVNPWLTSCKLISRLSTPAKAGPENLIMSTWIRPGARFSCSDEINFSGSLMIKRAVKQIHADDAERFLLIDIGFIEHAHVDDDLARLAARLRLKTNAEPAVRFVVLLETARRHRVGKNEKCSLIAELRIEPFEQKFVFVIEHRLEPHPADISIGRSVDRVAERHVVGRHRFGDRAGRAAHMEKPARHFLAGADLRERPVLLGVQINLERLLVRSRRPSPRS